MTNHRRHLDDTDRQILAILEDEGRVNYDDLAERIGVSAPTASARISKLVDDGVIERFTVEVNHEITDPVTVSRPTLERAYRYMAAKFHERSTPMFDADVEALSELDAVLHDEDTA